MRRLPAAAAAIIVSAFAAACGSDDAPLSPGLPAADVAAASTIVTSFTDDGPGSLRQAIADADPGSTIGFDSGLEGGTITLLTALAVDKAVVIDGPAGGVTLAGGGTERIFTVGATGDLTLRDLTVRGGSASNAYGGSINSQGTLRLEHVLMTDNRTLKTGTLDPVGGGIYSWVGSTLTIVNSTISGNVAVGEGGGIFALGTVSIDNSTITLNQASEGSGFFMSSPSAELRNSIVAGNEGEDCSLGSALVRTGRNLTDDPSCGPAEEWVVVASGLAGLAALADNGGPTRTHKLIGSTPAIDGATDCTVSEDQRHVARPQHGACDIGAYELDEFNRITLALGGGGTVNSATGASVVSGTVACTQTAADLRIAVTLRQTQKVKRLTREVVGSGLAIVNCPAGGARAWSVAVTPNNGPFAAGAASLEAATDQTPANADPASAARSIKLTWERR